MRWLQIVRQTVTQTVCSHSHLAELMIASSCVTARTLTIVDLTILVFSRPYRRLRLCYSVVSVCLYSSDDFFRPNLRKFTLSFL